MSKLLFFCVLWVGVLFCLLIGVVKVSELIEFYWEDLVLLDFNELVL